MKKLFRIIFAPAVLLLVKIGIKNSKAYLLFADPRGGSTWLSQVLTSIDRTILIWEPLHPQKGLKKLKQIGSRPSQEEAENSNLSESFKKLFRGKDLTTWMVSFVKLGDAILFKNVLIKFIRGNGIVFWLVETFQFDHKPIVLLRHPIPVALSQIRAFKKTNSLDNESRFIEKFPRLEDRHSQFVLNLKTRVGQQVAIWCLHNSQVLSNLDSKKVIIMYYELLMSFPTEQLNRIELEWGVQFDDTVMSIVKQPSATDFKGDFKEDLGYQLNKWKEKVTEDELKESQQVLDYFRVKLYNTESSHPQL